MKQLVLIKSESCGACKMIEPDAAKKARKYGIGFKTVDGDNMPAEHRPKYYPYFYLLDVSDKPNQIIEEWGGGDVGKLASVLNRNLKPKTES
jgi:thiol-disulfide isomerase/thioredoxin